MAKHFTDEEKAAIKEIRDATIQLYSDYYEALLNEDWEKVSSLSEYMGSIMKQAENMAAEEESSISDAMYLLADEAKNMVDEDEED